jgi:hypothetical protein
MKTIKLFYTIIIIAVSMPSGFAQNITANLIIAQPSAYVSEWNKPTAGRLIIVNTPVNPTQTTISAKIYSELKDANGTVIASSNMATSYGMELRVGATILGLDQVIQLDNLHTPSPLQNLLTHSGRLKAGMYQLGVQVFIDSLGYYTPKTIIQYRTINIASYQLPYLVSPINDAILDAVLAKNVVIFRWTSLVPLPTTKVHYLLQVCEMQEGQSPMQALQSNMPILEKTIEGIGQYIWQTNLSFTDSVQHKFIWTIKAVDAFGNTFEPNVGNRLGISEPSIFYIQSKKYGINEINKENQN